MLRPTPILAVVAPAAVLAFCVALSARALVNSNDKAEQREAVYARDGESADEAHQRLRLEACVSSEFGLCPPYD